MSTLALVRGNDGLGPAEEEQQVRECSRPLYAKCRWSFKARIHVSASERKHKWLILSIGDCVTSLAAAAAGSSSFLDHALVGAKMSLLKITRELRERCASRAAFPTAKMGGKNRS